MTLIVFIIGGLFNLSFAAGELKTYSDKQSGYQIQYPVNGRIAATGENVRKGFYLDPLQPVVELMNEGQFANARIDWSSVVKIAFPNKYLIMLVLNNVPANTPPPDSHPIKIGNYTFYQQHSWDAGMCHNYDYYTYFLEQNNRYYVFIFLITKNCFANQNAANSSAHFNINTQEFDNILRTVQLKKL